MTFSIELHGWRGFETCSDLFYVFVRMGFFTFAFSKELVSDSLRNIERRLGPDATGAVVALPPAVEWFRQGRDISRIPHEGNIR